MGIQGQGINPDHSPQGVQHAEQHPQDTATNRHNRIQVQQECSMAKHCAR